MLPGIGTGYLPTWLVSLFLTGVVVSAVPFTDGEMEALRGLNSLYPRNQDWKPDPQSRTFPIGKSYSHPKDNFQFLVINPGICFSPQSQQLHKRLPFSHLKVANVKQAPVVPPRPVQEDGQAFRILPWTPIFRSHKPFLSRCLCVC